MKHAISSFILPQNSNANPWTSDEYDKMESMSLKEFNSVIDACRFFYKKDPIASTAINKFVEIGITELFLNNNGVPPNELRVYESLLPKLKQFSEAMALEFLLSGLVVPEISYGTVGKEILNRYGIKKYSSLTLPISMWIRDPSLMKIESPMIGDTPSYFVKIPDELQTFIMNHGTYSDGSKDPKLYAELCSEYPLFVSQVLEGVPYVRIENDLIFRRKVLSDSPYPIPFLYPAIEPLKHKRNIRRMDYSIAARVIGAIQLIKLGSDTFPVTEEDKEVFEEIKNQMFYRDSNGRDIERIFQLYANHTLDISWVVPPVDALLDENKYSDINKDIVFALGIPRMLIAGESEKTQSGNAELSTTSPVQTMETFRDPILMVLRDIVREIADKNNFKNTPIISFKPINLNAFKEWATVLFDLLDKKVISKDTISRELGFSWESESEKLEEQVKVDEKINPVVQTNEELHKKKDPTELDPKIKITKETQKNKEKE